MTVMETAKRVEPLIEFLPLLIMIYFWGVLNGHIKSYDTPKKLWQCPSCGAWYPFTEKCYLCEKKRT